MSRLTRIPGRKSISREDPMLVDVIVGKNLVRKWLKHVRNPHRNEVGLREEKSLSYAIEDRAPKSSHRLARRRATEVTNLLDAAQGSLPHPVRGVPAAYPGLSNIRNADHATTSDIDRIRVRTSAAVSAQVARSMHPHECDMDATSGADSEALETAFAIAATQHLRKRRLKRLQQ